MNQSRNPDLPLGPSFVALVTGASRGIGRGIALALGTAGATVLVSGRTQHEGDSNWQGSIETTARQVTEAGGRGIAVRCDHACDEDVRALMARAGMEAGGLDLLVNNAYSLPPEFQDTPRGIPFWNLPQSVWDHCFDTGLRAHYLISALAVPNMIARGGGMIVNISSNAADGYMFNIPYGVAKAAIERMSADMSLELRQHLISVLALRPGPIRTERILATPWSDGKSAASVKRFAPISVGQVVVALVLNKHRMGLSGRTLSVAELLGEAGIPAQAE